MKEKDLSAEELKALKTEVVEPLSAEDKAKLPLLEEMMKVGLIYGRKKSKTNPKMKPYIFTFRNGIALFDLTKTIEEIDRATEFLKGVLAKGGRILFVGTQPAARDIVKSMAEELGQFYINERWLGGILTNYKTIGARIEHFKKLKADRAAGRHDKYTKKEQLLMTREIDKLTTFFSGVEQMGGMPAAVFVINTDVHETAVREAKRVKVPVVAFMSSDGDPTVVEYPVPANCNARPAIMWVMERFKQALKNVKIEVPAPKAEVKK